MLLLQQLQTALANLSPITWLEVEERANVLRKEEEERLERYEKFLQLYKEENQTVQPVTFPTHVIAHTTIKTLALASEVTSLVDKYASLVYDLTILRRRLHRLKFKDYDSDNSRSVWHVTIDNISAIEAQKNKLKEELKELHGVSSALIKRINVSVDANIPHNVVYIRQAR